MRRKVFLDGFNQRLKIPRKSNVFSFGSFLWTSKENEHLKSTDKLS